MAPRNLVRVNIDERHAEMAFAARGMSSQEIEYGPVRKALGGLPGILLGYGFITAAYRGDLSRSGFDLWLTYAAIALGVFIFPRSMRFAMTVVACVSPLAALLAVIRHHSLTTIVVTISVGLAALLVRAGIKWFRPEPFATAWPTQ